MSSLRQGDGLLPMCSRLVERYQRAGEAPPQVLYVSGPQPPGRDPLPGRGRIPTESRESSGENVYRYDALLFIVHK